MQIKATFLCIFSKIIIHLHCISSLPGASAILFTKVVYLHRVLSLTLVSRLFNRC
ncbi:hypothetical protein QWZ13_15730 [Reinekea marina]|uniref:hypothetical protein n=1 Tax=Reinekea marina TaxID=1310421 RepID=UPI0025B48403|nr:hypothetical protein [Reinekea marina]MDN3650357.1 hypothetical protein [Reinekea marina]